MNSTPPLLIVITAAFNVVAAKRTETFREMAESVSALQQYLLVEHLIQDGNSQDGSSDLYREYDSLQVFAAPELIWKKMASGKKFPLHLFRQLLKRARPQDRFSMVWW